MKRNLFLIVLGFIFWSVSNLSAAAEMPFPSFEGFAPISGCEAKCGWNECSGSGECVCECGFFRCTCSATVETEDDGEGEGAASLESGNYGTMTMSADQYASVKSFAQMLYESGDQSGMNAYKIVYNIVDDIKVNGGANVEVLRESLLSALADASYELKTRVNKVFIDAGFEERV